MSPDERAAHYAAHGWRYIGSVPSNPDDLTIEHARLLAGGDLSALRDITRLAVAGGDASHVATDEQPRRLSQRHSQPTPQREAV